MISSTNEDLKKLLEQDPGNPVYGDFADGLRRRGDLLGALQVCLSGLSSNPGHHLGRLVLARVFYDLGCMPFALRELVYLRRELPDVQSIKKLVDKLSPAGAADTKETSESEEAVFAEADFDFDDISLISKKND